MYRSICISQYLVTIVAMISFSCIGCDEGNKQDEFSIMPGGNIDSGTFNTGNNFSGATSGVGAIGGAGTFAGANATDGLGVDSGGTLNIIDAGAIFGDGSTSTADSSMTSDASLIDSTVVDSTVVDSTVVDSTVVDSTVVDSTVVDSTVDSGITTPTDTCLQGEGDFSAEGPYNVQTEDVTVGSSGRFTIYIPTPLEEDCQHPLVAWGNGTTVPGGTAYRHFNGHMASWGIVVIASHDDGQPQDQPRIGDGSFHKAGIDYLLAENDNPDSKFYGKLNGRAGVTGHSQGGAGGDRASDHPNVEANGNVQGSFGRPPPGDVAFLCLTGTTDIAVEGCLNSVNASTKPSMYACRSGMGHTSTMSGRHEGSQQYARLLSAWFRCFLADDKDACAMFQGGDSCPLCQESGWDSIFSKNF